MSVILLLLDIRLMIPFTSVENWFVGGKMGFDGSSLAPTRFLDGICPDRPSQFTCNDFASKAMYSIWWKTTVQYVLLPYDTYVHHFIMHKMYYKCLY